MPPVRTIRKQPVVAEAWAMAADSSCCLRHIIGTIPSPGIRLFAGAWVTAPIIFPFCKIELPLIVIRDKPICK